MVFMIGHCVPSLDVSKLIDMTVFDGETVSHSFFNLLKRLCRQIFVHIMQKLPFCESSALSSSTSPVNSAIRVS